MGTQISLKLTDKMLSKAKKYLKIHGFDTLQDFIRDTLRNKLFEETEQIGGRYAYLASEKSLAKDWLSKEEDKAWKHLEKEI